MGLRCADLGAKQDVLCCLSFGSREPLTRLLWGEDTEVTRWARHLSSKDSVGTS